MATLRIVKDSKKLLGKGCELLVIENFTEGSNWDSLPYTRYALLKNGKQIDGMDAEGKHISHDRVNQILQRNKGRC